MGVPSLECWIGCYGPIVTLSEGYNYPAEKKKGGGGGEWAVGGLPQMQAQSSGEVGGSQRQKKE